MKALLKREFFIFKHNFIPYLCTLALMPMAIYIFISYPMYLLIKTHSSGINYLHWSSIGNMIFSSSVVSYIVSLKSTISYRKKNKFLKRDARISGFNCSTSIFNFDLVINYCFYSIDILDCYNPISK